MRIFHFVFWFFNQVFLLLCWLFGLSHFMHSIFDYYFNDFGCCFFSYRKHCLHLSRFVCCVWVDFQRLFSSLVFVAVTGVVDNNDMDDGVVDDDVDGCCLVIQFSSVDHFSLETFEEGKFCSGVI